MFALKFVSKFKQLSWRCLSLGAVLLLLNSCSVFERTYSSHNNGPTGYGAWYALLERLQLSPERWENRYNALTEGPAGAMLIRINEQVEPREELIGWVREGNVLIELENPQPLTPVVPDQPIPAPMALGLHIRQPLRVTTGLAPDAKALAQRIAQVVTSEEEAGQGELLLGNNSQPLLVIQPLGDGLYIYGVLPDLALNRRLQEPQNYQFLTNLVYRYRPSQEAPIYFDEVIHGYGPQNQPQTDDESPWWRYLFNSPLALMLVQGGLILVVWIIGQNQRLSLPYPSPTPERTTNLEYIQALASTYQRAGASRLVLSLLIEDFRRQAARKLGSPERGADDLLITLWGAKHQNSAVQLQALLAEHNQTTPLSPTELLARVDLLQRLRHEVNG